METPTPNGEDSYSTPLTNHEAQLQAYYAAIVDDIDARLDMGEDPAHIEGYVTTGGYCHIFHDTSTNAIIKMPRVLVDFTDPNDEDATLWLPPEAGTVQVAYKEGLERGKNVPGLEQIITTIDDGGLPGRGAVVCEFVPGQLFKELPPDAPRIPGEYYDKLLESLIAMAERNLVIDNDPSNLIYDESAGFTIIDYSTIEYAHRQRNNVQGDVLTMLKKMGRPGGMLHPSDEAFHVLVDFNYAVERRFGQEVADETFRAWNSTQ